MKGEETLRDVLCPVPISTVLHVAGDVGDTVGTFGESGRSPAREQQLTASCLQSIVDSC